MDVPSSAARTPDHAAVHLAYDVVNGNQVRLTVTGCDLAELPGYVVRLMIASGPPLRVELDLSSELSLNPAGIAFLLRARTAILTGRGELRLQGVQPRVRDQLAAIGLSNLSFDARSSAEPAERVGCMPRDSAPPRPRPPVARTASAG